jgi:hypothetical protein
LRLQAGEKMVVTVAKDTIIENIYKNFYDLISAISGFTSIVYPSFPEVVITNKSSYPIVVINSPEISWDQHTFGSNVAECSVSVEIYTTSAATTDQYASDVHNKMEISKGALSAVGIRQLNLESTDTNFEEAGKIKVHQKNLNFKFKVYFSKTFAY